MIEARGGGGAGHGQTNRVNEGADFHAEIGGDGFKARLQRHGVELLFLLKRFAQNGEQTAVLRNEMFGGGLRIVSEVFAEIESAIVRQLGKRPDLPRASGYRRADILR